MTAALGENAQRVDGPEKVRGRAIYGADRVLPRMAHALPVTATIRKGRIAAMETRRAQRVPGVLLILTHENFDRLKPVKFSFAGGTAIQSFQPMQSPEVKYRGQAIASPPPAPWFPGSIPARSALKRSCSTVISGWAPSPISTARWWC